MDIVWLFIAVIATNYILLALSIWTVKRIVPPFVDTLAF